MKPKMVFSATILLGTIGRWSNGQQTKAMLSAVVCTLLLHHEKNLCIDRRGEIESLTFRCVGVHNLPENINDRIYTSMAHYGIGSLCHFIDQIEICGNIKKIEFKCQINEMFQ